MPKSVKFDEIDSDRVSDTKSFPRSSLVSISHDLLRESNSKVSPLEQKILAFYGSELNIQTLPLQGTVLFLLKPNELSRIIKYTVLNCVLSFDMAKNAADSDILNSKITSMPDEPVLKLLLQDTHSTLEYIDNFDKTESSLDGIQIKEILQIIKFVCTAIRLMKRCSLVSQVEELIQDYSRVINKVLTGILFGKNESMKVGLSCIYSLMEDNLLPKDSIIEALHTVHKYHQHNANPRITRVRMFLQLLSRHRVILMGYASLWVPLALSSISLDDDIFDQMFTLQILNGCYADTIKLENESTAYQGPAAFQINGACRSVASVTIENFSRNIQIGKDTHHYGSLLYAAAVKLLNNQSESVHEDRQNMTMSLNLFFFFLQCFSDENTSLTSLGQTFGDYVSRYIEKDKDGISCILQNVISRKLWTVYEKCLMRERPFDLHLTYAEVFKFSYPLRTVFPQDSNCVVFLEKLNKILSAQKVPKLESSVVVCAFMESYFSSDSVNVDDIPESQCLELSQNLFMCVENMASVDSILEKLNLDRAVNFGNLFSYLLSRSSKDGLVEPILSIYSQVLASSTQLRANELQNASMLLNLLKTNWGTLSKTVVQRSLEIIYEQLGTSKQNYINLAVSSKDCSDSTRSIILDVIAAILESSTSDKSSSNELEWNYALSMSLKYSQNNEKHISKLLSLFPVESANSSSCELLKEALRRSKDPLTKETLFQKVTKKKHSLPVIDCLMELEGYEDCKIKLLIRVVDFSNISYVRNLATKFNLLERCVRELVSHRTVIKVNLALNMVPKQRIFVLVRSLLVLFEQSEDSKEINDIVDIWNKRVAPVVVGQPPFISDDLKNKLIDRHPKLKIPLTLIFPKKRTRKDQVQVAKTAEISRNTPPPNKQRKRNILSGSLPTNALSMTPPPSQDFSSDPMSPLRQAVSNDDFNMDIPSSPPSLNTSLESNDQAKNLKRVLLGMDIENSTRNMTRAEKTMIYNIMFRSCVWLKADLAQNSAEIPDTEIDTARVSYEQSLKKLPDRVKENMYKSIDADCISGEFYDVEESDDETANLNELPLIL